MTSFDDAVAQLLELADLADRQRIDPARLVDGRTFLESAGLTGRAKWGRDDEILAAVGEATWLAGLTGTGKTTLIQQVLLACLGLVDEVLGYPVVPAERRCLYLAMDRPSQAARSFARMVPPDQLDVVAERLSVWQGPPPTDLAKDHRLLIELAALADASDVFIDSMKDAAIGLKEDEVGAGVNRSLQAATAAGLEVFVLHHNVKSSGTGTQTLSDVYGSTWLTAGAGSVLLLDGRPGDLVVTLRHLKTPESEVGPLELVHDPNTGTMTAPDRVDLADLLTVADLTVDVAARALYRTETPTRNELEKARRRLNKLVATGDATVHGGQRTGAKAVYRSIDLFAR